MYFGPCLGARAHLGVHAPLACGRPWLIPFPPSPRLRKLQTRKGRYKHAKEASKTIESYGWYSGLCLGATVRQVWTARWYLQICLPPSRFKWQGLGKVLKTFDYLTVLWEGVPRILQRARAPREPRRGQRLAISDTLAPFQLLGPSSERTRPWHVCAHGLSRPLSPHA